MGQYFYSVPTKLIILRSAEMSAALYSSSAHHEMFLIMIDDYIISVKHKKHLSFMKDSALSVRMTKKAKTY